MDELQTFVGRKRNKLWIWTAVNHKQAGILAWVIGDPLCRNLQALVAHRQGNRTVSFMSPMAVRGLSNVY